MPASPISKIVNESSDVYPHLERVIIPDQSTGCYWSVWYNLEEVYDYNAHQVTAHLMWCPIGDDPSVNDSWSHAEEIDESCRNVLTAIESVYGVDFKDSIWVDMTSTEVPSLDEVRKACGE